MEKAVRGTVKPLRTIDFKVNENSIAVVKLDRVAPLRDKDIMDDCNKR